MMGGPGGQPGSNPQGGNPLGTMNMAQMQGGMPTGFMIPQQTAQQQQGQAIDQKNGDKNGQKPGDPTKKAESGKKDDKPDIFPPPIDPNASKVGIPSFLAPNPQFNMMQQQGKDQKGQPTQPQNGVMPKTPGTGQIPQMIAMSGMPGGGAMMLTP